VHGQNLITSGFSSLEQHQIENEKRQKYPQLSIFRGSRVHFRIKMESPVAAVAADDQGLYEHGGSRHDGNIFGSGGSARRLHHRGK
jgi:hypothetical protein